MWAKIELVILPNFNKDELYLKKIARKYSINKIITFGIKKNSNYFIEKINKINNFNSNVIYKTQNKRIKFNTSTSFNHHILNLLIIFIIYNYNLLNIKNFIKKNNNKLPLIEGRGLFYNIIINKKKVKLIDESYNASPASMLNCIDYFENFYLSNKCKKIIILGEMLELGKMSEKFHKQILTRISNTSIDIVIICGKIYKKIFDIEDSKLKEIYL